MATSELSAWDGCCTSQLNIILLGGRNSGKSSVGNLILGKEEFDPKERTRCSRRLGVVAGRWLTVVDAPGWWCDFSAQDTPELVKREIISSVALCPPGPHVFLITVKASSAFTERRRRALEEHVALLGDRAWSHSMVVFTSADRSRRVEEEELEALRWLTERCGQRCHSVTSGDGAEASGLLEKMQRLVAENGSRVFEVQEHVLQTAAGEKRGVEERAQQRMMRMKKHRSLMRERLRPVTDIRIVLVGAKGSGKTSTLNTILSRENGRQLRRTARSLSVRGVVFGRRLTVVDTPGWWMNYFCDESPAFDRREVALGLSLCPPGPHVFLLVVRLDRAFTETYRRAAQEHLELLGEHIWGRVIVLFSFGDWLGGATPEQCIESEGEPLRWLVERCGNRYHVLNNTARGDGFQVRELIGKIEETLVGNNDSRSSLHYGVERRAMEQMEVEMRGEEERAKGRATRKEKQRQMARSQLEKLHPLPELRAVLVGGRRTGKSSCGNTILGRDCFHAETPTAHCAEKRAQVGGRTVVVLDTPGCFSVTSDLLGPACALLLVVNVSSSFNDARRRALENQLEARGGQAWRRAAVLFSHGDWLGDTSIEERIEGEGVPLQRLVEKCGNRYHVLDNKHRGDGAQVDELIRLMEETLVEERLAVLHRGDHLWDAMTTPKRDLKVLRSRRRTDQVSCDVVESANGTAQTSCSDNGGQIVVLRAGRRRRAGLAILDGDGFMSRSSPVISAQQRLRWTISLPVWIPSEDLPVRRNGESQVHLFSRRRPKRPPVRPQTQHRTLVEDRVISVDSLHRPALTEQTLRRLSESGGLQALIDQWGHSSLEELEAFIDSYFETVWEEAMGSFQPIEPDRPAAEPNAYPEEVLASIDRKLSKLDLLEEMRKDLAELRTSVEHGWKTIQELRGKSKPDDNNRM